MDDSRIIKQAHGDLYSELGLGEPISRKISHSHVMPRQLADFERFFRQSSSREEGMLDIKLSYTGNWEKKWVVFDDGVLYLSDSAIEYGQSSLKIAMDRVISIRTDKSVIALTTADCELHMKANSIDEMNKWIFCFQKSVALVLSKLLSAKANAMNNQNFYDSRERPANLSTSNPLAPQATQSSLYPSSQGEETDVKMWLSELGHGHGRHSIMLNKRNALKAEGANHTNDSEDKEKKSNRKSLSTVKEDIPGSLISSQVRDAIVLSPSSSFDSRDKGGVLESRPIKNSMTLSRISAIPIRVQKNDSNVDLTQLYSRESGQVRNGLNSSRGKTSQSYGDQAESFMAYARPPISFTNPNPTNAIPITKTGHRAIPHNSDPLEVYETYEQKIATSYNQRFDMRTVLSDEDIALRMQMEAQEALTPRGEEDEEDGDEHAAVDDKVDPLSSHFDRLVLILPHTLYIPCLTCIYLTSFVGIV